MIGIYKITSPTGKVYIGQSVDVQKRFKVYERLHCKNQTKLHNSLVKYGFSKHIFEVVEECTIEQLNERERYWQDFYNVLSENGLNCRLTEAEDRSGRVSPETVARKVANTDYSKVVKSTDYQARTANTNYKTFQQKRLASTDLKAKAINTDWVKRTANTDYKKRTLNTDYTKRTASTDYGARAIKFLARMDYSEKAKKCCKAILQYTATGILLSEYNSVKEAAKATGAKNISACCKGTAKTSKGFIWKYKEGSLSS